jgi:hypothetical protein
MESKKRINAFDSISITPSFRVGKRKYCLVGQPSHILNLFVALEEKDEHRCHVTHQPNITQEIEVNRNLNVLYC